ncbi:sugar dehydrogenase, partial [Corynebacterium kefirresidentii]
RAETLEMIPAKEIGEAQDVANVALFLASDLANYIHGTTIYVDGGMTNYPAFMGGKG